MTSFVPSSATTVHGQELPVRLRLPRALITSIAIAIIGCAPGAPQPPGPSPEARQQSDSSPDPIPDPPPQYGLIPAAPQPSAATGGAPSLAGRTIWEGVYTEAQRHRGAAVYASSCVRCHGEELEGDDVVYELVGEEFLARWSRKRAGNLFAFMKEEMPPKREDRLTPAEYADVLAYILSMNQAPAGEEELSSDFAALQAIRMSASD